MKEIVSPHERNKAIIAASFGMALEWYDFFVAMEHGLLAIIPARNEDVPIYRTKDEEHLPEEYNRRPIVEAVHSVIKRKSGSFVRSRIPGQFEKEIALKIIAYNIRRILALNDSGSIYYRGFSTELHLRSFEMIST